MQCNYLDEFGYPCLQKVTHTYVIMGRVHGTCDEHVLANNPADQIEVANDEEIEVAKVMTT